MKQKLLLLLATLAVNTAVNAQVQVDPDLEVYKPVAGVSGKLNSIGSDTLNNLMTFWTESFQKMYPNVKLQVEGKGSSTAPPALIANTSQLGPMSREMKSTEMDKFEQSFGYKATNVRVAIDALAVFVHKDNPIKGLNLKQLDSIFSSTLKRGGKPATKWEDVGATDSLSGEQISVYGRNSASGTYGYFKKVALKKGDYKNTVKEQPGSSAVVQGIATSRNAIGYSGIGYLTSGVRALPIAEAGSDFKAPSMENCLSGDYPIARFLNIYINKKPGKKADKLTYEFIRFILSKEGQEIVVKDGFFPLPAAAAAEILKQIQ